MTIIHAVHISTHITYTNIDLAYSFAKTSTHWQTRTALLTAENDGRGCSHNGKKRGVGWSIRIISHFWICCKLYTKKNQDTEGRKFQEASRTKVRTGSHSLIRNSSCDRQFCACAYTGGTIL